MSKRPYLYRNKGIPLTKGYINQFHRDIDKLRGKFMQDYYIAQNSTNPWPKGGGYPFSTDVACIEFLKNNDMNCDSMAIVSITAVLTVKEAQK